MLKYLGVKDYAVYNFILKWFRPVNEYIHTHILTDKQHGISLARVRIQVNESYEVGYIFFNVFYFKIKNKNQWLARIA